MGTEGHCSLNECGNPGSQSFLSLIKTRVCHFHPLQAQRTNWILLQSEITEDNSKQTRKLGMKRSGLGTVHRCFWELVYPRGSSHQRRRVGQQRVPLCHCANCVSGLGDGFPL